MRKILFFLLFALLIVGCQKPEVKASTPTLKQENQKIQQEKPNSNTSVIIKEYYQKPKSADNPNTVFWKSEQGSEYVELNIIGEILNLEVVSITFDEKSNEMVENSVLHTFGNIKNQTVLLCTALVEGIPAQKIKFKSTSGKMYEFIIAYSDAESGDNKIVKTIDVK